jgi:thiamine biosynthesis lipoprotein
VKGWAIQRAAELLANRGYRHYFVEAGGDAQTAGLNCGGEPWRVGIRNPFRHDEIVKVLAVSDLAVATSGTAIRGRHIYNPHSAGALETDLVSLTVVGPSIYDADRMATAAFAMGVDGIAFLGVSGGLDGYAVTSDRVASFTEGFLRHVR